MAIPSGVGQVEVEITYVYGGFPTRQVEYLASQFALIHRIRGDNNENLEYIKNTTGVLLHVQEVAGNDGVKIQMQHPSIDGMKQGFECLEGLLEQVTSDFDAMREGSGLSDLEWKLRYGMKSCLCPECGRMKIHLKDLEQHYNQQHVSEKYDMMMIKISGASPGVRRSVVENALGEFGSISYTDMEAHPRDIYVKFVRPVAVEKALAYKRGKLVIDGKQVQLTRPKIGEVDGLREELIRKRKESDYASSVETGVFLPYQTGNEWAVDKFVEKAAVQNFHPTRIYVRGFRKETDRRQLKDFFDQFGRVEEVRIKDPGQTKAYGFVEFRTKKALEKILGDRDVSYLPLEGSQLTVKRVAVNRSDDQFPDMSDIQPETVRQIYVEGFPNMYDQRDLVSFFKVYGDIKKCTLVKASGDKPRHALVTFSNMSSVEELQKEMVQSGGLYIRGIALMIERTSDQIEKAIRKRTEERKRKFEMGQNQLDYFKKTPAIEHKAGVAKPGLPLMEIKQKLDIVAKQISSYGTQELSADKFWSLRNQWEWLNTTKAELTKEAERELFSIPRSDGLDASTMAAAVSKLQEALEKLVDALGTGKTTGVSSKMNPAVSESLYKNLPIGTKLTGTDWRGRSQSAASDGSNRILSTNVSVPQPGFWGPPVLKGIGYSASNTYYQDQSHGGSQSQLSYIESLSSKGKAFSDNMQTIDMDVSDDEDKKQTGRKTNWSTSPGKNTSWDPYRISVLGFTPLVEAKDLQKMFTCHGLAREVRIYLEHDIRYAFMTFPKQKTIKNLFKGKLGINLQMKDMKLICNRIQESKIPGATARLLSKMVEEPPEKSAKSTPVASSDAIPLVLPIPNEQFVVLQLLANVEDLVSPPRAKPLTEAEMLEDLQEREARMVHSLQYQLGHENPERVVRIIKHLRCIHNDITIQRILFHLNKEELQAILYSTSKPELVKAVQTYVPEIENAKSDTTEINLYHLIRKMVVVINDVVIMKSPAYRDMYDVTTPGISESHPIVISDMPDTKSPPKERTTRWDPDRTAASFASQLKNISGAGRTGGFVKKMTIEEKRKGLQKLLGELSSDKRQKVEDIFREEVNVRRNKGELVDEQEEINIYITALGEISKRKVTKESDRKDTGRDEKREKEKQDQTSSEERSSKDQSKQTGKEKINSTKKRTEVETRIKGKSSSNGKISLEGLSMAEKRLRVQKALEEIPPFISSKVKSRQKLALTKMKSEGKQVGEQEELNCVVEAFNHMFNEEGNIMAHVLRDQIFKQKGDYRLKRDHSLKQLHLPQFDEQVKKFRNFDQCKQAEEMKTLRESLSVLLKILLFKRQDKVFEDAEKSGIVLTKLEKNIVRYQILLDMTQAVVIKREEKEKGTTDITAGAYHAEKEESGDEFDDDGNSHLGDSKKEKETADRKETQSKGQKRPLEEPSHKTGGEKKGKLSGDDTSMVIENGDDDDDVIINEDPQEVTTVEKDEVEKILNEISSDEDVEVDVEEYDETKLLEDIEESSNKERNTQYNVDISIENNEGNSDIGREKTVTKDDQTLPGKELCVGDAGSDLLEKQTDKDPSEKTKTIEDDAKTDFRENIPDVSEAEKGNEEESSQKITESKEEMQARLETAFREVLTPAQRRTILGRMTKAKKVQQAAGNELSDEETMTLRYSMITGMLEKHQSRGSGSEVTTTGSPADTARVSDDKEADKDN